MKKKDYKSASLLMTQNGLEEFVASRFIGAVMMSRGFPGVPGKKFAVIKKYKLDSLPIDELMGLDGEKASRKIHKLVLSRFKDTDDMLAALAQLDKEKKAGQDDQNMIMVDLDFFIGEVVETIKSKEGVVLKVKPSMPGGPDGGMMMMGEVPDLFLKFRKDGDTWKWDGIDKDRVRAQMGDGFGGSNRSMIEDPDFEGTAFSGEKVKLKDYRGKLVLIDFWGTWCKPCVAELPKLQKIYEMLKPHGFEIVGIAADDKETLAKFFKKKPLPWACVVDGENNKMTLCDRFEVNKFPTTLLIDQEGNHVASDLHGPELIRELAERLKLDEAAVMKLEEAVGVKSGRRDHGDHGHNDNEGDGDDAAKAKKSGRPQVGQRGGQVRPRMAVGFTVADVDGDKKVSTKEMQSYLSERLVGLDVPLDKIFKRLDTDNDTYLDESEFSKRHVAIQHIVGPAFKVTSAPADPGKEYAFFPGTDQPVDDRSIMGALMHRSMEAPPSGSTINLDKVPASIAALLPEASSEPQSVERLARATAIVTGTAEGAKGIFTAGAVLISSDGLAVTNYHIAEALGRGDLTGFTTDGKSHRVVEFLAGNKERDVALIRLEGKDFVHVPIAKDAPKMGDDIVMLHHTENRFYTYDRGYVMRHPMVGSHPWMEISTDYAPGGSGCGIYNARHELVGLVSMVKFGDGPSLGQAVSLDELIPDDESGPQTQHEHSKDGEKPHQHRPAGRSERGMIMVKHAVPLSAILELWQPK